MAIGESTKGRTSGMKASKWKSHNFSKMNIEIQISNKVA